VPHAAGHGQLLQEGDAKYFTQLPVVVQISSGAHTVPQPPQWTGLPFMPLVSTQLPLPQSVSAGGQFIPATGVTQVPAMSSTVETQYWPAPHFVPQLPQFAGSDARSTQAPLQPVRRGRQAHPPLVQTSESMHSLPQLPQFLGSPAPSFCVHEGAGHERSPAQVQTPLVQTSPGAQWWPHEPQLATSLVPSGQAPPPQSSPPLAHWHCPSLQVSPAAHAWPQDPQSVAVVWALTQPSEQAVLLAAEQAHLPLTQDAPVGHPGEQVTPPALLLEVLVLLVTGLPPAPVVEKDVVQPSAAASRDTTRTT